jgi:hypothetical protein
VCIVRTIGVEERRARLGVRHALARPAASVEAVAADLVGLHSSDPATVYLSARARVKGFEPAALESALYERRSLVRMLGMRRTLFVVPVDLAGVMDGACTKALVRGERTRLIRLLEEQGIADDGARWLARVERRTFQALAARGEAAATELTKDVPELGARLTFGEGKTWGGSMGVSTRVLFLLATEGRIVRARPRGAWTSGQYRWATTERWLDGPLPEVPHAEACAELLRRWLRTFGPATLADVRWWTGWTARLATTTLASVGAIEVALDDGTGYVVPDDTGRRRAPKPWVALLPGLDPTVMGWKERSWYLGDHGPELFDRNGNAGPTVWANGRVVGGWARLPDGGIEIELLEPVGSALESMIERERGRLSKWIGDTRLTPRFRTPMERRLTG